MTTSAAIVAVNPWFNNTPDRSSSSSSSSSSKLCVVNPTNYSLLSCVRRGRGKQCIKSVAVKQEDSSPQTSSSLSEEEAEAVSKAKVGVRVRVKVPLKVYHVPKVPEIDIIGIEGKIKQYVGLWKGKRISANLPFKVEFLTDIEGRGPVKFFAHLKEDEFEYIQD